MSKIWTQEELALMRPSERHEIVIRFAKSTRHIKGPQSWSMTNLVEPDGPEGETYEQMQERYKNRGPYCITVEVYKPRYQGGLPDTFEGLPVKVTESMSQITLA